MKLCVMDERSRAADFGPCGEEILGRAGEESDKNTQKPYKTVHSGKSRALGQKLPKCAEICQI